MRPALRLEINGKPASAELLRRVVSVTMTDYSGAQADNAEITIDAAGGVAAPSIGAEVQVWLGYEPAPMYRGKFKVASWSLDGPPSVMSVRAVAADFTTAIKAPKTRSHHDTTLGAIVNKIAGEHGLGVAIDGALASRKIDHIDQQTESDAGFLTRLAGRNGAVFKIGAGRLIFAAKGSKLLPDGTAKARFAVSPSMVSTWSFRADERGGYLSVKAAYYDKAKGKRVYCTAGQGGPCHRDRRLYATREEAQAAADAKLGDLTRGKMTGNLHGPGRPEIYAEAILDLAGFAPDCDGEYLAKTVTHTFGGGGYVVDIEIETLGASEAD